MRKHKLVPQEGFTEIQVFKVEFEKEDKKQPEYVSLKEISSWESPFRETMSILNQYDALVLANSTHYREVFEYLFRSEEKEAREALVVMYIDQAISMGGIFYSKKYNSIMFGVFEKQNKLAPNDFINRLKNTL